MNLLVREMVERRGEGTVRITEVKGFADEGLVPGGQAREIDRVGNTKADEVADSGRRKVGPGVFDARRNLAGVCRPCCPCIFFFSLPSLAPF